MRKMQDQSSMQQNPTQTRNSKHDSKATNI